MKKRVNKTFSQLEFYKSVDGNEYKIERIYNSIFYAKNSKMAILLASTTWFGEKAAQKKKTSNSLLWLCNTSNS